MLAPQKPPRDLSQKRFLLASTPLGKCKNSRGSMKSFHFCPGTHSSTFPERSAAGVKYNVVPGNFPGNLFSTRNWSNNSSRLDGPEVHGAGPDSAAVSSAGTMADDGSTPLPQNLVRKEDPPVYQSTLKNKSPNCA